MADSLVAQPDSPPVAPLNLTPEQRIAVWVDLMDTCEQFLLGGLRRRIGPDGDLQAAFRAWYAKQMDEHDEMMIRMIREFDRRSNGRSNIRAG